MASKSYYLFLVFLFTLLLEEWRFGEGTRSGLTPEDIVRLEMEEFEEEMARELDENVEEGRSREKRTVIFNTWTAVNLGLLLGIPFTIILPTLTNFFNWKWKRSVNEEEEEEIVGEEDPILQLHLDRISSYFQLVQIPETQCQRRAVCEFAAEPEKYFPLSELVLNRVRQPGIDMDNSPSSNITQPKSLFSLLREAGDEGLAHGSHICELRFANSCPYPTQQRLNMPALSFWNLLSSALQFTVRDDVSLF